MSAEVRAALADAASTVGGLTGHPYFVQVTEPGNVLIRLERIEYPNPFGGVAHWNAVLVLPQDSAEAEKYIESHVPGLLDALKPHLSVTSVVPQRLDITGVGVIPVVFVNGHRED